ncbi:MAG: metal ABC transporter ATP-binding protein [Clostridia bacterium]|nr:metal ABC transporter ATP-binding protein [Clostridia bacterium]
MALMALKSVTIAFEGLVAVDGVSLTVEKGDYLVVLGENGSGKSTLMRAMLGLVKPRSGAITCGDGLRRDQIGYLPQQTAAQRDFPASVEEVVLSGCANRLGRRFMYNRADRARADRNMALLDVARYRRRSYRTLSGGQQQRVLLARALCATDALLILDEPVTGLDPAATDELYDVIRDLNQRHGVAIVMVSHDLRGALRDAKHVLVMDRGPTFFGDVEAYMERYPEKAVTARG